MCVRASRGEGVGCAASMSHRSGGSITNRKRKEDNPPVKLDGSERSRRTVEAVRAAKSVLIERVGAIQSEKEPKVGKGRRREEVKSTPEQERDGTSGVLTLKKEGARRKRVG